jgi:hypothetical protein
MDATVPAIKDITGLNTQILTTGGTSDGRYIAPTGAQVIEGITLPTPVPDWILEIWKLVAGKKSLPLSQTVSASSVSAGVAR